MYGFAPYDLADGGPEKWEQIKEIVADGMLADFQKFTKNMGPENILARTVCSPVGIEESSLSFQHGDYGGIGRFLYQFLGRRPTPELSQYAVPGIGRLYLSGPFMHPGGGVIGGGRATAIKILDDLGMDFAR
jgi:phytoene dehydrogenase-like protein